MNLWESVHRGLDKASREAARIGKMQKLRSAIDGLGRQINTQNETLIHRVTELFINGDLQQSELLPICQELSNLQQQLNQTQNELRQLQQGPAETASPYNIPAGELPATPIPPTMAVGSSGPHIEGMPPDYQPYSTMPPPPPGIEPTTELAPPPPPGVEPATIGSLHTFMPPPPNPAIQRCPTCQTEVNSQTTYCHLCGSFIQTEANYLPTVRGSSVIDEQGTIRAESTMPPPSPTGIEHQPTIRSSSVVDEHATVRTKAAPPPPPTEGQKSEEEIIEQGEGA